MAYLGDFKLGSTITCKFTTVQSTGAPTTLSGSPVVKAYIAGDTTEITGGITLTADYDSKTGLNDVTVIASAGNGYATAKDYDLVITTGTVNSVSVVNYVVGSFSIENRVVNYGSVNLPLGANALLGIVDNGTLQSATATTAVLRAAASFADDRLNGMTIVITGGTGVGQARLITDYDNASDTATVDTWTTTPDNTSTYIVFASPVASSTSPVPAILSAAGSVAMTESYATDGAAATLPQLLYLILGLLSEFSVSSTTMTVKKLDGSTTAATLTLNSATSPTSITRAS